MSDEIFFDGRRYISAQDAAVRSNFTRDYVARLCRDGRLVGRRVGKAWFVAEDSLNTFLIESGRSRTERSQKLTEERRREYESAHRSINDIGAAAHASSLSHIADIPAGSERVLAPIRSHMRGAEGKARSTFAAQGDSIVHAMRSMVTTAGMQDAALHTAHIPTYFVSPFAEFVHKLTAMALAVSLTFGTYALIDTRAARLVSESTSGALANVEKSLAIVRTVSVSAQVQLAAAAGSPGLATASIFDAVPSSASKLARSLNARINAFVYDLLYPKARTYVTESVGTPAAGVSKESVPAATSSMRIVSAVTAPPSSPTPAPVKTVVPARTTEVVQSGGQPVIEPSSAQGSGGAMRIVTSGGISEAYFTQKLQELDNKLSSRMYSLSNANTTVINQNYGVTAQTNAIHQLQGTNITNPFITGGSISGMAIGATSLTVSGATNLDDTTTADLTVNGQFTLAGTSSVLTVANIDSTNASTTNLAASNATLGTTSITYLQGPAFSSLDANFIPKWSSGTFANSLIFSNSSQVGVNTSTNLDGAFTVNGAVSTQSEGDIFRQYDETAAAWYPVLARYWDMSTGA